MGLLAGSASALFLAALDFVTQTRLQNSWLLYLLPCAGLLMAWLYSRHGHGTDAGNNLLIDEIHNPKKTVPLRMAPLVLFSTLLTHLCGGSAGREGTAVQMGGSLADQLSPLFKLTPEKRKTLLMSGIAGGFASVFGTPLAGTIFGIEVLSIGRLHYKALVPCLISAIIADRVSLAWGIHHTVYTISTVPELDVLNILWAAVAGICFGLCAYTFSWGSHRTQRELKKHISSPLVRIALGGVVVIALTTLLQSDRYLGLGIPQIVESFQTPSPLYDFALKMLFTIITLSAGFKGGEVTPLFFIGATLGSALTWLIPLPTGLLAGMGFVAVFAGAANTPLACILMAVELFGTTSGAYMALACVMSYFFSGHAGIYTAQKVEVSKYAQKN